MNTFSEQINEHIMLSQLRGSLSFGTDAYLLYAYMRKMPKEQVCELGAGSGVISLLAAASGKVNRVDAYEIQAETAALAAKNVEENALGEKVRIIQADIRTLPASANGTYGAVFSNPPYQIKGAGPESENTANRLSRFEYNGTIADFCACASRLLRFGGLFTVVYRPDRLCDLFAAMRSAGLEPKRLTFVYPTERHVPCLVLTEAKKGAAPALFTTKPLIIYQNQAENEYTPAMKYIYENGDFQDDYFNP